MLDFNLALKLAGSLKSIDGFPWDADVVRATAEDLCRWCQDAFIRGTAWSPEKQAFWLVTEAREKWTKWQGTAALQALLQAKFSKPVPASARRWVDEKGVVHDLPPVAESPLPVEKAAIVCERCADTGTVQSPEGYQFCGCPMGLDLSLVGDGALDLLNNRGRSQTRRERRPAGEEERSFLEMRKRTEDLISENRAILDDPTATSERKEIAHEALRAYGVEKRRFRRASKKR